MSRMKPGCGNIWLNTGLLFESDRMTIMKYTGVGPYTKAFTTESPARAAVWLGWKIIESYTRKFPDLQLSDLMKENDYQKILTLQGIIPDKKNRPETMTLSCPAGFINVANPF